MLAVVALPSPPSIGLAMKTLASVALPSSPSISCLAMKTLAAVTLPPLRFITTQAEGSPFDLPGDEDDGLGGPTVHPFNLIGDEDAHAKYPHYLTFKVF